MLRVLLLLDNVEVDVDLSANHVQLGPGNPVLECDDRE